MQKINFLVLFLLVIATKLFSQCACCAGAGSCGSINNININQLTLNKKQWLLEANMDYRKIGTSEIDHIGAEEETPLKSMLINSLGIRYGISNKFTVSASLPYVFLHTHSGNDKGFGDLSLVGTYKVFTKKNFNLALQAGVELPTGIQKSSNFDNTTVVLGSGSFDPIVAVLFSKKWNRLTLQGNGLLKYTTKGFEGNYYGSVSAQSFMLNYAFKYQKSAVSYSVFGGYYGEYLDHFKEGTEIDENSGYYLGFASMGTVISHNTWSMPLTLSVPIIQKMNGDQNNANIRFRLGVVKVF